MNHYSDPTANAAIGAIDRQIKAKQKIAKKLKEKYQQGRLTPEEAARARRQFPGLYRRFYDDIFRD